MYCDSWLYELTMPRAAFANPNPESIGLVLSFENVNCPNVAPLFCCCALNECVLKKPLFNVCLPATFVMLTETSCVELMFRYPANGMFGGAFAMRLPQVKLGVRRSWPSTQKGGVGSMP